MLSWTLLAAEVPFSAAKDEVFPSAMAKENTHAAPSAALWVSNGIVQLVLLLSLLAGDAYLTLIKLATSTILVPYLLCALFALKLAYQGGGGTLMATGAVATLYSAWLLYAAGPVYLLLTALVYAPGLAVHAWSCRGRKQEPLQGTRDWALAALVMVAALVAVGMIGVGTLDLKKI
jgi:arginine:ornithine antiporter / lysine permease